MTICRHLLFVFLMATTSIAFPQILGPEFKRLTTKEGLSQGHVNSILKDHEGFMWFTTDDGLNKYDGYKFTVYKNDPDIEESISNNFIYDVIEDSNNNLWVGTASGLDKFKPREK